MKTGFRSFSMIALAFGLLSAPALPGQDADGGTKVPLAKDKDGREAEPAKRRSDGAGKDRESDVSEEDRERMNRLLRQVWGDPAVVQSRDEVRVASDNLRKVLSEKMRELDPEAADLLARMRKDSRFPGGNPGESRGPGGRKSHHSDNPQAGLDYMARPPFYAALSEEDKEIYDAAYKKAQESEELAAVATRLDELRKEDDDLRKKRIQQFMRARKVIYSAMIKADPRVEKLIRMREEGERREGGPRSPKPPKPPE
jgi:hypothetical protein